MERLNSVSCMVSGKPGLSCPVYSTMHTENISFFFGGGGGLGGY